MKTDYVVCAVPNCVLCPVFFSLFCFNVVFFGFFLFFGQSRTGQRRTKHFKLAKVGLAKVEIGQSGTKPWPKLELAKVGRARLTTCATSPQRWTERKSSTKIFTIDFSVTRGSEKTMIELGRSEEVILEMDRLASEDHSRRRNRCISWQLVDPFEFGGFRYDADKAST